MSLRRVTIASLLVVLWLVRVPAATLQMSVSEIRPGMVGIGRTVFEGTRVEEFRARILGVIENVIGTRRNLILARLEGGPLANTGVIAGMSGSPVYIDGKLIGAVSYSLGSFSKEPIAGITPIAEMTDATRHAATPRRRGARVQLDFPLTPENLTRRSAARSTGTGRSPIGPTTRSWSASAASPALPTCRSARCSGRLPRRS